MNELAPAGIGELIARRTKVLIVDVRESEAYAGDHIEGAHSIPAGTLAYAADESSIARNDALLNARDATVVVYCEDGRRSRGAAAQLAKLGFADVRWLAGGLCGWRAAGLPLSGDRSD